MEKKYVFISKELVSGSFGESRFSKFSIESSDDMIAFKHIAGRAPTLNEFASAVLETVFDDVTEDIESMPRCASRCNPYRLVMRTGYSGCEDYYLEESRCGDVVRHKILHISMDGKLNIDMRTYTDDVLQLLSAFGWLQPETDDNGKRHYTPVWCAYKRFVALVKITPRNIANEPGWHNPDGTMMFEGDSIVNIHETCGGHSTPSIFDGAVGKFWKESAENYEEYCREKAESQIG